MLTNKLDYLREVLESSERDYMALPIKDCNSQVSCLNELEDLGVRVDAVVHVVLSNLYQVNNLIAVIRVSPSEDNAVEIEFDLLTFHTINVVHLIMVGIFVIVGF